VLDWEAAMHLIPGEGRVPGETVEDTYLGYMIEMTWQAHGGST
jgi:hypothetical protein